MKLTFTEAQPQWFALDCFTLDLTVSTFGEVLSLTKRSIGRETLRPSDPIGDRVRRWPRVFGLFYFSNGVPRRVPVGHCYLFERPWPLRVNSHLFSLLPEQLALGSAEFMFHKQDIE